MSTVHDFKEGRYAVIKGAPDVLIGKANSYLQNEQILTDKKASIILWLLMKKWLIKLYVF